MNQIEIALNDDEWTPELSDSTQAMISFRKNCSHHMQEIRESLGRTIVCLEYRPTRNTARRESSLTPIENQFRSSLNHY